MTTGCPRWKRFHQHLLAVYCTIAVLASAQDCECIVRPLGWPNSTEISCANYGMPSVDGTCCEWYSDNADNTGCQHLCVHSLQVMRRAATSHGVAKLVYVISCKRFDDASVSAFAYVAALVVVPIAVCCIGVTVTKRHQSQQSQGGEKEALGHGFVRTQNPLLEVGKRDSDDDYGSRRNIHVSSAPQLRHSRSDLSDPAIPPFRVQAGMSLCLNTSNDVKFQELRRMLLASGVVEAEQLKRSKIDLREVDALPKIVVAHKATVAGVGVLVEDTSLDIDGREVGIHIKWFGADQSSEGKAARWRVMLAVLVRFCLFFRPTVAASMYLHVHLAHAEHNPRLFAVLIALCRNSPEIFQDGATGKVNVFSGKTDGVIVAPRGQAVEGFEFDEVFLPLGSTKTLAEEKPDSVNARSKAVENFAKGEVAYFLEPIEQWKGKWQE